MHGCQTLLLQGLDGCVSCPSEQLRRRILGYPWYVLSS